MFAGFRNVLPEKRFITCYSGEIRRTIFGTGSSNGILFFEKASVSQRRSILSGFVL